MATSKDKVKWKDCNVFDVSVLKSEDSENDITQSLKQSKDLFYSYADPYLIFIDKNTLICKIVENGSIKKTTRPFDEKILYVKSQKCKNGYICMIGYDSQEKSPKVFF